MAEALDLQHIVPEELPRLRGLGARALMRHFGLPAWRLPQVAIRLHALQARDIGEIRLFDGVEEMLAGLAARGVTLAIVTSNAEGNVRDVLGPRNAARIARFACGAPILGKASRLRKVLRATGTAPQDALAIGDELRDLEAARRAGIPAGAVTWGFANVEALRAAGPAAMFSSPAEILALAAC